MAKRKIRNQELESAWRERLARHQQNGATVRQFCREAGLKESSFYYWKRELSRRDNQPHSSVPAQNSSRRQARSSPESPALVPVMLTTGIGALAPIEVSLPSGVTLKVSSGCDGAMLRMVIGALEEG